MKPMKSIIFPAACLSVLLLAGCETVSLQSAGAIEKTGGELRCGDMAWVKKDVVVGKTSGEQLLEMCGNPVRFSEKLSDGSYRLDYLTAKTMSSAGRVVTDTLSSGAFSLINIVAPVGVGMAAKEGLGLSRTATLGGGKVGGVYIYVKNGKVVRYEAVNSDVKAGK